MPTTVDRPVYCHTINREIFKHLGLPVDPNLHRSFLRMIAINCNQPLYAGHAQVVECFYDDQELLMELEELTKIARFVSLSRHPTFADFLESRRQMYRWEQSSYPMYFTNKLDFLRNFQTHSQGDPDTTGILRVIYKSLYDKQAPTFENLLTFEERRSIEAISPTIRHFVSNESGALTAAFFRRIKDADAVLVERANRVLSRVLPNQFTDIYCKVYDAFTATGFPYCHQFENSDSFPLLDFDINTSLMTKLGLSGILFDFELWNTSKFISFITDEYFHEFIAAKNDLLNVIREAKSPRSIVIERSQLLAAVRSTSINAILWDEARLVEQAAFELRRTTERICAYDPIAREKRDAMMSAYWQAKYLIFTATDLEDAVLRETLSVRGFSRPIINNHEKFSEAVYFRRDIGKLHHVRTSAGSIGTSGSLMLAKNALEVINPQFVISYGICFGMRENEQSFNDIAVSEFVFEYEKQRQSHTRPELRGATRDCSAALLSRIRAYTAIWQGPKIHVGTIASGEKLVDDPAFVATLKKSSPRSIAGEMEAAGISAACYEAGVPFIMVKGIADFGHSKTDKFQMTAAKAAARLVFDALIV